MDELCGNSWDTQGTFKHGHPSIDPHFTLRQLLKKITGFHKLCTAHFIDFWQVSDSVYWTTWGIWSGVLERMHYWQKSSKMGWRTVLVSAAGRATSTASCVIFTCTQPKRRFIIRHNQAPKQALTINIKQTSTPEHDQLSSLQTKGVKTRLWLLDEIYLLCTQYPGDTLSYIYIDKWKKVSANKLKTQDLWSSILLNS